MIYYISAKEIPPLEFRPIMSSRPTARRLPQTLAPRPIQDLPAAMVLYPGWRWPGSPPTAHLVDDFPAQARWRGDLERLQLFVDWGGGAVYSPNPPAAVVPHRGHAVRQASRDPSRNSRHQGSGLQCSAVRLVGAEADDGSLMPPASRDGLIHGAHRWWTPTNPWFTLHRAGSSLQCCRFRCPPCWTLCECLISDVILLSY
jgi:hypothetical protein